MQTYILIAVIAYLAFALNGVIDKFLLSRDIPQPMLYAFYIGMLNALALLLIPFGVHWPQINIILIALLSGAAFAWALVAMFSALKRADASLVLPAIGAMVPIATLVFGFFIAYERLNLPQAMGVGFLVLGASLTASASRSYKQLGSRWVWAAVLAAVLFALSFATSKAVYNDQGFISGLVWTRVGFLLAALSMLFSANLRKALKGPPGGGKKQGGILFLTGQALGAGASILQNYAVSMGSVTIVNALQGVQFGFLILISWGLYRWFPQILKEDFSRVVVLKKLFAVVLIGVGLLFITK